MPLPRILLLTIACHLLIAGPAAADAPAADPLPIMVKRVTPGVVTVVAYRENLAMPSVGTGFFVAPDRVVTARHVLARVDRANVRTSGGRSVAVTGILAEERASDLVLVQLAGPVDGAVALPVAAGPPEVGERLFTVSSPIGLEFSAADGIVSAYREVPGAGVAMQHTVAVSSGSSGCPLMNARGEVVAVQTGVITTGQRLVHAGQALNFAAAAGALAKLAPGGCRPLVACLEDVPEGWVPPITKGIDTISLHAVTRDDFAGALPFFAEEVRRFPDDADALFRLGLCHEKAGRPDAAIEWYEKAIARKADFGVALNNLGSCLIRQKQFDRAVAVLAKAAAASPKSASAHANLAVACVEAKRWPEALAAAARAVELKPDDAEARLNLGTAAARTGDRPAAERQRDWLKERDKARAERLQKVLDAGAE